MFWVILIVLFLAIVIYILFARLSMVIDTSTNNYFIELKGIFKISAESDKSEILKLRTQIFFLNFNFYPLRPNKKEKPKKNKRKSRLPLTLKQGYRILKTFRIKSFYLDLDTGDCITNARLYPVFALLNYKTGNFNINFNGRNKLVLHIKNRPIYIIKSFINL